MATIYRCDRCSKEETNDLDISRIEYPIYNYHNFNKENMTHKDLCQSCISKLNDFMKPLSTESK